MSLKLEPKEILKYLNGLGYRNISSQQLKEFVRDLKILIKYDMKKQAQKANQENIRPNNDELSFVYRNTNFEPYSFNPNIFSKQLSLSEDNSDSTNSSSLPSSTTISSREESTLQQAKVISIEIIKPKEKKTVSVGTECICIEDSNDKTPLKQSRPTTATSATTITSATPATSTVNKPELKSTVTQGLKSKNKKKNEQPKVHVLKSGKSFIKPRAPANKFVKSDPVTLYQQYQKEWKKQKLPGEDKHYELRWAIRERMLGEPNLGPCPSFATTVDRSSKRTQRC